MIRFLVVLVVLLASLFAGVRLLTSDPLAAALIIGLSQLSKIIGVPFPRSDRYLADLWHVVEQFGTTHWPTLLFALGAYALIVGLRRFAPKLPGVLIAVLAATAISALMACHSSTSRPARSSARW